MNVKTRLDRTGAAIVDDTVFWRPMRDCIPHKRCILRNAGGMPTTGTWDGKDPQWTGWFPMMQTPDWMRHGLDGPPEGPPAPEPTPKLTLAQAVIVSGYTGKLCCDLPELLADIKRRLGYSVPSGSFWRRDVWDRVSEAYYEDFKALRADSDRGEVK